MSIKKMVFLIITVLFVVMIIGCAANETEEETVVLDDNEEEIDTVSEATLARYDIREIREYEGIQLDPSIGPRDNSINGIQIVDIEHYSLELTGLAENPKTLTYDEVLEYPFFERVITLFCVEGWDTTILWGGVRLTDLIDDAGVLDTANTVIFKAVDGYSTSMPLDVINERDMLLAYKANNMTLKAATGYPFIVVAEDKLGYKWARWVNEIELSDDENYLGYWEERGYPNDPDLTEESD